MIQRSAIGYLRTVLVNCVVAAIPNAARRTASGRAANAVAGMLPGFPDVQIVAPGGRCFFIEFKTARGRLSPAQEDIRMRFIALGVPHCVARSLEDVRAAVQAWGLPTREAASNL